jgi:hypothetical protein
LTKTCIDKKQYSEPCQNSNECSDTQSLLCINGTCMHLIFCSKLHINSYFVLFFSYLKGSCYTKYTHYSFSSKKCVNRKHEKEECSFSSECLEPMTCVNKMCKCNHFEYFDEIKCINKTLVNSPCQTDNKCHKELGLYELIYFNF